MEEMFGITVQRMIGSNSYSVLTLADTGLYDSMVAHFSSEEGQNMTGLELICGVKVPGDCVDIVSSYASQLIEETERGESVDIREALNLYARQICAGFEIH